MLEDRQYMRRSPLDRRFSATMLLIAINMAVFVFQILLQRFPLEFPLKLAKFYFDYSPLSLDGLKAGYLWQLVTYQFMHVGWTHLLFNCLAIFVFGRDVEATLGRKPYLALYLSSGVVGGLVQSLAGLISMDRFGGPVVGASAAAFGLAAAFALLYPNQILLAYFIIPIRAKYVLLISAVVAVIGLVSGLFGPVDPNTVHYAHAAHLGGMLSGILFIRYAMHWHWPRFRGARGQPSRHLVKVPSRGSQTWSPALPIEEDIPPEEFLSREVDPILEKISAHGIQSLTQRERDILEAARARMGKR
jgi:membrane associated rhomboid family serine protease